jgi:thymidylate synthase ThyX
VSNLSRWADEHQYDAEPQPTATQDEGVLPVVSLISMSADPLGEIASFNAIYQGRVVRSLADISDDERRQALADVQKTHLRAPLEAIKLHFLFEGVDRAFTHQHVRQRTAVYAQESMRFAVMGPLLDATTLPPSLAGTKRTDRPLVPHLLASEQDENNRMQWDRAVATIDEVYHYLVENGVPAEEARGLLPHATATRIHYVTDMRNLIDHAGNRLCTQAQFHWRLVFAGVVDAIRNYVPDFSWFNDRGRLDYRPDSSRPNAILDQWNQKFRWQFEAIAESNLFRPACYQLGHCPFEASFDRSCTIRERVEVRAKNGGTDSSQWHKPFNYLGGEGQVGPDGEVMAYVHTSPGIQVSEWLADPGAARKVRQ